MTARWLGRVGDACLWLAAWAPFAMFPASVLFLCGIVVFGAHAGAGFAASVPFAAFFGVLGGALARAWWLGRRRRSTGGDQDG